MEEENHERLNNAMRASTQPTKSKSQSIIGLTIENIMQTRIHEHPNQLCKRKIKVRYQFYVI